MIKWNACAARSETRRLKLHLIICDLDGLPTAKIPNYAMEVLIKWGVSGKSYYLPRRAAGKNHTSRQCISSNGCIHWEEGFDQNCKLKLKDSKSFRSWMINLEFHGSAVGSSSTASVIAKLKMDIADFASPTETSERTVTLPVRCKIDDSNLEARLTVKLSLSEFQTKHINSIIYPLSISSCIGFQNQTTNEIGSQISESDEDSEPTYRSLVATNLLINSLVGNKLECVKYDKWETNQPLAHPAMRKPSLIRLLSRNHPRDTPLLNKAHGEFGGDDIDDDRRCNLKFSQTRNDDHGKNYFKPFGCEDSDRFEVGNWERRKVISRDGTLELETEIFLASIDQRSERASGEGACTVLAAVIADWLHKNPENLPLRCQFDKLISEGSSIWRHLCKDETNRERFYDQHFDLDTVLQAQVLPLKVVPEKSYVGFFELENTPNRLELLQGIMSFDSIWEELQSGEAALEGQIYIVSWNDHFFVVKIEKDAIYTIDTLGERLFEGCTKAYILKFNKESKVYQVQPEMFEARKDVKIHPNKAGDEENDTSCHELICEGKSSCKQFIKGFLAALPLRELQADIKRGNTAEIPLHHLLQIEFHYTIPFNNNSAKQGDQILQRNVQVQ